MHFSRLRLRNVVSQGRRAESCPPLSHGSTTVYDPLLFPPREAAHRFKCRRSQPQRDVQACQVLIPASFVLSVVPSWGNSIRAVCQG